MGGPRDLKLSDAINRAGPGGNHFGLIAQTSLKLPKGRWRFRTNSDDGIRVLVNGKSVIENWTWHVPTNNDGVFEQTSPEDAANRRVVVEIANRDRWIGFQRLNGWRSSRLRRSSRAALPAAPSLNDRACVSAMRAPLPAKDAGSTP